MGDSSSNNKMLTQLLWVGGGMVGTVLAAGAIGDHLEWRAFVHKVEGPLQRALQSARLEGVFHGALPAEVKYDRALRRYYVLIPVEFGAYTVHHDARFGHVEVIYTPRGDYERLVAKSPNWHLAFLSVYRDIASGKPFLSLLDWQREPGGVHAVRVAGSNARIRPTPWGDIHHLFYVSPRSIADWFDYVGEGSVEELKVIAAIYALGKSTPVTTVRSVATKERKSKWIYCEDEPTVVARARLVGHNSYLELGYGERGCWEIRYRGLSDTKLLAQGEIRDLTTRVLVVPDWDRVDIWSPPAAEVASVPAEIERPRHLQDEIQAALDDFKEAAHLMRQACQASAAESARAFAALNARVEAIEKERASAAAQARAKPKRTRPTPVERCLSHVSQLRAEIPAKNNRGVLLAIRWLLDALEKILRSGIALRDLVGSRGAIVDQLAEQSGLAPCTKDRNVLRPAFKWSAGASKLFEQNNPKLWTVKLGQLDGLFGSP